MLILTALLLLPLFLLLLLYLRHHRPLTPPSPHPPTFPLGHLSDFFTGRRQLGLLVADLHRASRRLRLPHARLLFLHRRVYQPVALPQVERVLAADHCLDRHLYANPHADPLSQHLITTDGPRWRHLRRTLQPAFTPAKLRGMFAAVFECTLQLERHLAANAGAPLDVTQLADHFFKDLTAHVIFGLKLDTVEEADSPFRSLFKRDAHIPIGRRMVEGLAACFPRFGHLLRVRVVGKACADFFIGVMEKTIALRENNNYRRPDLMQTLVDLKGEGALSGGEVVANAYGMFLAGFDTSSTAFALCLYELSKGVRVQERVRGEVNEVWGRWGRWCYEAVGEMTYLGQVVSETLRKYPTVPYVVKKATREFEVGEGVVIRKGEAAMVSVMGLHWDEEYFPEPEKFDPERFAPERKGEIPKGAYMPFGGGQRICLGRKLALLEMAVGIGTILKSYRIELDTERTKEPIQFSVGSNVVLQCNNPIYIKLIKCS